MHDRRGTGAVARHPVRLSRRTFFNYYASKENAVLGIAVRSDTSDLEEAFLAGGGALLEDFAELHIGRWERFDLTNDEAHELGPAFEREPRLFAHFASLAAEGERDDIALVKRRADAGTAAHAETVVLVFGALLRPSVFEYFADDNTFGFRTILLRRLVDARHAFSA